MIMMWQHAGGSEQPAKLPDPDLSGAAKILPVSPAAHSPAQSSGQAKQAQQQESKPLGALDSEARPSAQSTGVLLAWHDALVCTCPGSQLLALGSE